MAKLMGRHDFCGRRRSATSSLSLHLRWVLFLWLSSIGLAVVPASARAAEYAGEFMLGGALNTDSSLKVSQSGFDDLEMTADWATRPFEQPLYWALRCTRHGPSHGFGLELLHHKIYLENPAPEIESFSITHGLNVLNLQYAWLRPRWRAMALAGLVIAHPENTVRGEALPESGGLFDAGYHVTGPALGIGAGSSMPVTDWLHVTAEARITVAWIEVDVVGGKARLTNLALHFLVGPSFRF